MQYSNNGLVVAGNSHNDNKEECAYPAEISTIPHDYSLAWHHSRHLDWLLAHECLILRVSSRVSTLLKSNEIKHCPFAVLLRGPSAGSWWLGARVPVILVGSGT